MSVHSWIVKHPHQDLCFIKVLLIMYPTIVLADPATQFHYDRPEPIEPDTLLAVGAEHEGFALLQKKRLDGLAALFGKDLESTIIENCSSDRSPGGWRPYGPGCATGAAGGALDPCPYFLL
jgi:hypothetical protein